VNEPPFRTAAAELRRPNIRRAALRSFAALATFGVLLTTFPLPAADEPNEETGSGRAELDQFLTERAGSYAFSAAGAAETEGESLARTAKPVLRYTAPVRDYLTGGAMFLWLDGQRPVAAGSLWIKDNRWCHREFTILADQPLICRNEDGQAVWTPPKGAGVEGTFTGVPAPAPSKALRLTQMRNLARRFSATFFRQRDGEPSQLRLMPQPVHRYAAADDGVLDGAVFVMAESNDPDLLVVITAHAEPEIGVSQWSYSLARMCSMKIAVRLDDREVHTFPYYWTNPRTIEDPYCEALDGPFQPTVPGDAASDGTAESVKTE
jgi:hypothetical protein